MADPRAAAVLDALSRNVLHARYEDLDRAGVERARLRILDMIGCALGGGALPDMVSLVNLVKNWGGKGEATVLGRGFKAPAHDAAMLNCLMGRSFDWGPLTLVIDGRRRPTHTSETTVLSALAMAQSEGRDGRELITALAVGDDLAARLWSATDRAQPGQAAPGTRREPGFEPWGTVTTFAAAAIAGRLMGLTQAQLNNAFGIALNMTCGAGSGLWDGATTFKLSQGTSARSGIFSARLAAAGWTGVEDPLFDERGSYFATFTGGCDHPEVLTRDLGRAFHAETVFKPYPGGRPTHAPVDAALALVKRYGIAAAEIETVTLFLSPKAAAAHYSKPYRIGAYPSADALFSYRYSVAAALVLGRLDNEAFTETRIRDPRIQSLIGRIELAALERPEGVALEVVAKGGRRYAEYVRVALGEPENPLSRERLVAKFMSQVEFSRTIGKEEAARIVERVDRLEDLDDAGALAELASGQPAPGR